MLTARSSFVAPVTFVIVLIMLFVLGGIITGQNAQNMFESSTCIIESRSKLQIHGTSNVTDFSCISLQSHDKKSISFYWDPSTEKLILQHTILDLEIKQMDCGGRGINRDFYKTLHADEYPEVTITLNSVRLNGDLPMGNRQTAIAHTTIGLAGKQRQVEISIGIERTAEGRFHIVGICPLHMSDFGIKPPTALFGLIKVDDRINIDLDLYLRLDSYQ